MLHFTHTKELSYMGIWECLHIDEFQKTFILLLIVSKMQTILCVKYKTVAVIF